MQTNGAEADGKAVWSWHPLLVLNLRRQVGPTGLRHVVNPPMTVTRRIRSPGRARYKPLKPLRAGMPGVFGGPRGDYARVLHLFRTRGCGCIEHPAFPTPSLGEPKCTTRAPRAAGMRSYVCRQGDPAGLCDSSAGCYGKPMFARRTISNGRPASA